MPTRPGLPLAVAADADTTTLSESAKGTAMTAMSAETGASGTDTIVLPAVEVAHDEPADVPPATPRSLASTGRPWV